MGMLSSPPNGGLVKILALRAAVLKSNRDYVVTVPK